MENKTAFYLVSAFTNNPSGGNPAVIVFVDPVISSVKYLGELSKNFNQPMLAAVSPTPLPFENEPYVQVRSIRFIVPNGKDSPICGHATLAAANILFNLPEVSKGVKEIHFKTAFGLTLKALKLANGFIEIQLPSAALQDLPDEKKSSLKASVDKAFGRNVNVHNMKAGVGDYEAYALIDVDQNEDLENSIVSTDAFLSSGYVINIVTSSTPNPEYAFVSRMFSPVLITDGEDPACGSAHGLLVPYWHSKNDIAPGKEVKARQVSCRGGELRVIWEKVESIVRLRGQCAIFASGFIAA